MNQNPHANQPVQMVGVEPEAAEAAMILIHGRGGGPQSVLPLISHLEQSGFAFAVPQAAGYTWYPHRFIAPRASNEPHLTSALGVVGSVVQRLTDAGIPAERIMLLGFSQGACLAVEYVARTPRRYGGVAALSGGLIGADGELTGYTGSLEGTPVFLGCSDIDPHIPLERVHETRDLLEQQGAQVDERIYPGMGHTINTDEVEAVNEMMRSLRQK